MSTHSTTPTVVVLGGPNGAGKTTTASLLLPEGLEIRQFVNADTLAAGLSAFAPETVALQAGRIMLQRLKELATQRASFAFETTMASRSFAPFLQQLKSAGYTVRLAYLRLQSPELAIHRVAERVRRGGHFIPDDTVRRRYERGWQNFRDLYLPLADSAVLVDNSGDSARIIAAGTGESALEPANSAPLASFFTTFAQECIRRATEKAVREHHLLGNPVYIWRDGIVRIHPDGTSEPVAS